MIMKIKSIATRSLAKNLQIMDNLHAANNKLMQLITIQNVAILNFIRIIQQCLPCIAIPSAEFHKDFLE